MSGSSHLRMTQDGIIAWIHEQFPAATTIELWESLSDPGTLCVRTKPAGVALDVVAALSTRGSSPLPIGTFAKLGDRPPHRGAKPFGAQFRQDPPEDQPETPADPSDRFAYSHKDFARRRKAKHSP